MGGVVGFCGLDREVSVWGRKVLEKVRFFVVFKGFFVYRLSGVFRVISVVGWDRL